MFVAMGRSPLGVTSSVPVLEDDLSTLASELLYNTYLLVHLLINSTAAFCFYHGDTALLLKNDHFLTYRLLLVAIYATVQLI